MAISHPSTNFSQFILQWKWVFGLHPDHWNRFKVSAPTILSSFYTFIIHQCMRIVKMNLLLLFILYNTSYWTFLLLLLWYWFFCCLPTVRPSICGLNVEFFCCSPTVRPSTYGLNIRLIRCQLTQIDASIFTYSILNYAILANKNVWYALILVLFSSA